MTDSGRHIVLFFTFCLLAWAVVGAVGVGPILGLQHDEETAGASFAGASNLSVEVESVRLMPSSVTANGSETVTVALSVRNPADVNTSRFTLAIESDDRAVAAANVTCNRECTLRFPERTVASLADGPGEYELVVIGWWNYDRRFVGQVSVTVTAADGTGPGGDTQSSTPTNTSTPTSATPANTSTPTNTSPPTNTSTPTTTTTPSNTTATPTSTPTSTNSTTTEPPA